MAAPREQERQAAAGGDDGAAVQQAVEQFIDRHGSGQAPDPVAFTSAHPEPLRPRILAQIRQFLAFDGYVGSQTFSPEEVAGPQGRQFGDFVIQEELGRGGMGVVYLAWQRSLNRRVALKVMASGLTLSKRHVERFRREASAAAQLRHPGIVAVHSFAEVDGTFAFAMDFVAGRNLADILDDLRLRNGAAPAAVEGTLGVQPEQGYVAECALLCAQLAAALGAAHRADIAHRDLKPRNVMVDEHRQARLLDFGLAKSLGADSISLSGEITGTAHYMSPEQTLAKRVELDHRTDIFSLGVILYELLTLRRPFDGRNLQQVVYEICFKEPTPIPRLNPKVPRDLVTVCMKALEKDPGRRYQTAAEMEADLQRFLRWEPVQARPAGALSRIAKWTRRHRAETMAAAVVLTLLVGAVGWTWYRHAQDRARSLELLQQAERAAVAEDFDTAIQRASEALALQPEDGAITTSLELIQQKRLTKATREQRDLAESNRMLARSSQAQEFDRELALLLALEALRLRDSSEARSAVLQALGSGYHVTTLAGHTGQLYAARFDADGRRCATAGTDGRAVVWDAASGQPLCELKGHGGWVVSVAFQPAGELIATASQDGSARLWHAGTGTPGPVLRHDGTVDLVQFDREGQRLLTTSNRYQAGPYLAQVWDVATASRLSACSSHTRLVGPAAIAPDGRHVASFGDPGFVRLWRADDGAEVAQLPYQGRVSALCFAPDGKHVAVAGEDGSVRLFAVPSGAPAGSMRHSRRIDTVAFAPDGAVLLTAARDHTARLWSVPDGRELVTLTGHGGPVACAGFDRTGRYVVTGSEDRKVRLFDAGTGAELARLEVGQTVKEATLDPDARRVLLLAAGQRALLWDLSDTHGTVTMRHTSYVRSAFFTGSAEEPHLVTLCDDEFARVWNARNGQLLRTIGKVGDPVLCGGVDPAGERLVTGTSGGDVSVFSLWDGERLFQLGGHGGKNVNVAAFGAGGARIVTCGDDRTAVVWNANDRATICRIQRPAPVVWAALDSTGQRLVTVDDKEPCARLWSVPDGRPLGTIGAHSGAVTCAVFSPDDGLLLTVGDDHTARLNRLSDGAEVRRLTSDRPLRRGAFSPRGDRILTCGSSAVEHAAQLWDTATGAQLLRFAGHQGRISAVAFSADGAWAATCSMDRHARVWPTDPVAVAGRLSLRTLTDAERSSLDLPQPPDNR